MQSFVTLQKVAYIYTTGLKWVSEHPRANSASKNSSQRLRAPDPQTLPSSAQKFGPCPHNPPLLFQLPTYA